MVNDPQADDLAEHPLVIARRITAALYPEKPKRKRGAPVGNTNARKHGRHSRNYKATIGRMRKELSACRALARRAIRRVNALMREEKAARSAEIAKNPHINSRPLSRKLRTKRTWKKPKRFAGPSLFHGKRNRAKRLRSK